MSWIIEQSDDASSAITTQGNTVTCQKEDFYGSPINVLWKDPAEKSGLYYWQIDFLQLDTQGSVGVGLTTQDHFKVGYAIKFMEYNVISFSTNGKATIIRSKQVPTSLDRQEEQFNGIEGHWKLTDYPQHSDCTGYHFHLFQ
ncbi:unnamed protein product [Rotaria sp. Silwood1]|nr:unnamed protein product [Rotaria sp. Silwood1]